MVIATWVIAVATAILAISGPIALATWLSGRRSDRERQQRERESRMQEETLGKARREFVNKNTASGSVVLGGIAALIAVLAWLDSKKQR